MEEVAAMAEVVIVVSMEVGAAFQIHILTIMEVLVI